MEPRLIGIREAVALGMRRDTVRRLIARKELRAVRVARRVMVSVGEIERACLNGAGVNDSRPTANN